MDSGDTVEAADAALGLAEAAEELEQTIPEHQRRKPRKKRDEGLPAHFPRHEVVAECSEAAKSCPTHGARTLLPKSMWDRTETLEFERPKAKVRVTSKPRTSSTATNCSPCCSRSRVSREKQRVDLHRLC